MKTGNKRNIEEYIIDLNEIVSALNDNAITLDEAVKLYKKGMAIASDAQALITVYEQEVQMINQNANEGRKELYDQIDG